MNEKNMYKLYIYKGHYEGDVFIRDNLLSLNEFKNMRDIRGYFGVINTNFDEFDYLIESPDGAFNSIYRYNF